MEWIKLSKFINIIINPVGDSCNLQCKYCYTLQRNEEEKKLSIEKIYKLIDYLSDDKDFKCINFTWHGGEPLLMGKDYFKEILEYQRKKLKDVIYCNVVQSNGVLLDEQWIELIQNYHINLGVSIDGPDYMCNSERFSTEREFNCLLENLKLLKNKNCLPALFFTLTKTNINKLDEIFSFIELYRPYAYMFNPVMDSDYAITAEEFKEVLLKMREFSCRTNVLNTLTYHIDRGVFGEVPQLCFINGMCHKFISMNNNGDIFASCINHEKNTILLILVKLMCGVK